MILNAPTLADAAPQIVGRFSILTNTDPRHGTRAGYDAHRRLKDDACDPCKAAVAAAEARRHMLRNRGVALRLHPCTIQRRLQALVAIGYSYQSLDRHLGYTAGKARDLAINPRAYITRETYTRIRKLYDTLSMTPAPSTTPGERQGIAHARRTTTQYGFVPPLAWDDDKIDDPDARPHVDYGWGTLQDGAVVGSGYPVDKLQARAAELRDCYDRRMSAQAAAREMGMASKDTLQKWCGKHEGFCGILQRMYRDLASRDTVIAPDQRRVA